MSNDEIIHALLSDDRLGRRIQELVTRELWEKRAGLDSLASLAASDAVGSLAGYMLQRWKEHNEKFRKEPTLGPIWIIEQLAGDWAAALAEYGRGDYPAEPLP